jgi:hypothetical protein
VGPISIKASEKRYDDMPQRAAAAP